MQNKILELNAKYSTTRSIVLDKPSELREHIAKKYSGGLRMNGYFKKTFSDKPLISIITVVFNGEEFLEETILSIISQTYDNVEYIIIDGGSSDGTLEIIKKYEDKIDYWISEEDKGMYDALNKGLSLSTGEIINFCNSDDLFCNTNVINSIVEIYKNTNFDCCYGDAKFIDENSKVIGWHKPLKYKRRYHVTLGSFFVQPTFFWTREVMNKVGYFDLSYKIISDRDFIIRIALASKKIEKIDMCIAMFRKFGESFGDENTSQALIESPIITNKYKKILNINSKLLVFYDRIIQKLKKTSYIEK